MILKPPTLAEIREAHSRIAPFVYRTPLLQLHGFPDIYLKLENLQPIGSFKIRGSGNAMEKAGREALTKGVFTASAGNMAQGVAWNARRLSIEATAVVPDHAPSTKLDALERLGSKVIRVPFDQWWNILITGEVANMSGFFVHPVCDADVIAGNGTIGLEIVEDLPDVETIFVPYGGGGLSCGIAAAVRELNPKIRVIACEVETAAPLTKSWKAGKAMETEYTPSFVDGIGGKSVLPAMWPMVRELIHGVTAVSLEQIRSAIRLLAERNRVIAEGAGAASVAAALQTSREPGKKVCVISGGNIDAGKLCQILHG